MSYVTSPFWVMFIVFILCVLASVGVTTLLNKIVPFSTKNDLIIGACSTVIIFVASIWAIF
jgi:hypothetical protein